MAHGLVAAIVENAFYSGMGPIMCEYGICICVIQFILGHMIRWFSTHQAASLLITMLGYASIVVVEPER